MSEAEQLEAARDRIERLEMLLHQTQRICVRRTAELLEAQRERDAAARALVRVLAERQQPTQETDPS